MLKSKAKKMVPTIINPSSKFVVVTYWWGSNNLNKNMQRPCPEDVIDPNDKLVNKPVTYDVMIETWENKCIKANCNYMAIEYPEFAQKGQYQNAINFKPQFVLDAMDACYPRGVLYIDGDMTINRYPHIFDIDNVDYMAYGWSTDGRVNEQTVGGFCFDPYVLEISGGTMFFANTVQAKKLAKMWTSAVYKNNGKADDRIMSLVFNINKMLLECNIMNLPLEYWWLSMNFDQDIDGTNFKRGNIHIEHPHCLTSEERATTEGAHASRFPKKYDFFVSNHVQCMTKTQWYEYIYFPNKTFLKTHEPMMTWYRKNDITVTKYDDKYGKYNKVANQNIKLAKDINTKHADIIFITLDDFEIGALTHVLDNSKSLIPTIIKYMDSGIDVCFVPTKESARSITHCIGTAMKYGCDLVCKNDSKSTKTFKKEYSLEINENYPVYFSHKSQVLKHLVTMSANIKDVNNNFNACFIFVSRIRCMWI